VPSSLGGFCVLHHVMTQTKMQL